MGRPSLYPVDPKPCVICGTIFERRVREQRGDFAKRQTCGSACGIIHASRKRKQSVRSHQPEPPGRVCTICDTPLVRGDRESYTHFLQRLTCGKACEARQRWRTRHAQTVPPPPKTCGYCGQFFYRRANECAGNWNRRQTCNESCRSRWQGEKQKRRLYGDLDRQRFCAACGLLLVRRTGEHFASFWRRKTCDQTCGSIYACRIRQRGRVRVCPYPTGWHAMRESIRTRDGHACRVCGAGRNKRKLPVHHIDYDKHNCVPSNLITLCETCHNRTTKGDRLAWVAFFAEMMSEGSP